MLAQQRALLKRDAGPAPERVVIDEDAGGDSAAFVARLRDAATEQVALPWLGLVRPSSRAADLVHLQPPLPELVGGPDAVALDRWRDDHRPGLCYYRQGPGFLTIQDLRGRATPVRFMVSDRRTMEVFLSCLRPQPLAALPAGDRALIEELEAERLVARFGDTVVTLPYRMKRWPIPAQVV